MAVFDYKEIPIGYYDQILSDGGNIRKSWHIQKFERVLGALPKAPKEALLDIGCFAGSFLSLVPESRFKFQLGIDILPDQIQYAQTTHGKTYRQFEHINGVKELSKLERQFDCITLIEVIEHLEELEVKNLFEGIAGLLKSGGHLVFSSPNYTSTWPILEVILNHFSDVSYEEQHITKFNYFNLFSKLNRIYPKLWDQFEYPIKTTTHFISPFLSGLIGVDKAARLSRWLPHSRWKFPFGNLLLATLQKKP